MIIRFQSQKQAKAIIQASIDCNDAAVLKALKMIYSKQTATEQAISQTNEDNHVGFSAFDADILSSFARQAMYHGMLSDKQMVLARKKVRRYWKQLAVMSGKLEV